MAQITVDLFKDTTQELNFVAEIVKHVAMLRGPSAAPAAATPAEDSPAADAEPETAPADIVTADTAGVPYDPQTHSTTRALDRNGRWKYARGLPPDVRAAAESRDEALAKPLAQAAPPPPPPPPPPPVPVDSTPLAPVAVPGVPSPPSAGDTGSVSGGAPSFREVMNKVTTAIKAGKLSHDVMNSGLATVGFSPSELAKLAGDAEKLADFNAYIDASLVGK